MDVLTYRVKVKELLVMNNITAYRLAQAMAKRGVSEPTAYAIVRGSQKPSLHTLALMHVALEELLQRRVELDEILELER